MKILLINDYGIEIGGAETYLKNLKLSLQKQGHDVRVLTSESPKNKMTFSDYTFKGLNMHSPFRLFPYMFNIDSYKRLKQILAEFKPDIVHIHFTFYHTSPSILLALKNFPTVMTTHAHEIIAPVGVNYSPQCKHPFIGYCIKCTGILKYYPEVLKRLFFRLLSKRIKLFIAPSKYYAAIHKHAGYSPIVTVYNGIIENDNFQPVNVNNQNLLFVGRLAVEKGAEFPIRALPLIHKKFPKTILTIVGDGPEKKSLEKLIKELNLSNYVTMAGKVPNQETEKYYQNASLVVVPSTYPDNLPTVCIEAMNYGRIIIASNIGGLPELVKDNVNGLLVRPKNYEDIAHSAIKIFSDKKRLVEMSTNSRDMIAKFNITKNTESILTLYKKVIQKK